MVWGLFEKRDRSQLSQNDSSSSNSLPDDPIYDSIIMFRKYFNQNATNGDIRQQNNFVYQDWSSKSLCAQTDPELFFVDRVSDIRMAQKLCDLCSVKAKCFEEAIKFDQRFGVWGGASEKERRKAVNQ